MGSFHQISDNLDQQSLPIAATREAPKPAQAQVSFAASAPNQAPQGKGGMASPPPPPTTQGGKGGPSGPMQIAPPAQPAAKGGSNITYPSQSGQPEMGAPNKFANTVQPIDNQQASATMGVMKGKGI